MLWRFTGTHTSILLPRPKRRQENAYAEIVNWQWECVEHEDYLVASSRVVTYLKYIYLDQVEIHDKKCNRFEAEYWGAHAGTAECLGARGVEKIRTPDANAVYIA